jgi:hypothetical protein
MKYITYNDQELLSESYNSINVKQIILESSVGTFIKNAPNVNTLAEAYAILDIYNDLVEEGLFGGLANVAKGVGGTIARGAQNVASGVASGVSKGAGAVAQGVKTAGQVAGAAANTVGGNISSMYTSGSNAADAQKAITEAQKAADQLKQLLDKVKQLSPGTFKDSKGRDLAQNVMNLPLGSILTYITKTGVATQGAATAAKNIGVLGGVGAAMSQAYQGGAPATATP